MESLSSLKLTKLDISHTKVSDLKPLKNMPLEWIRMTNTKVKDLSPLYNIKTLKYLEVNNRSFTRRQLEMFPPSVEIKGHGR